jgi:hypothetical protein
MTDTSVLVENSSALQDQIVPANACVHAIIKCSNIGKFIKGCCDALLKIIFHIFIGLILLAAPFITIALIATPTINFALTIFVSSCILTSITLISGLMMDCLAFQKKNLYSHSASNDIFSQYSFIVMCAPIPWFSIIVIISWLYVKNLLWYHQLIIYMPIVAFGIGYLFGYIVMAGCDNVRNG